MRKTLRLSIIFLFTMFFSCEKELYEDTSQKGKMNYKFKFITFNEVNKYSKFVPQVIEDIGRIANPNSRSGELYGTIIDLDKVNYVIQDNGVQTFTFRVESPEELSYLENIIVNEFPNGQKEVYKAKFNLDKSLEAANEGELFNTSIINTQVSRYNSANQTFGFLDCVQIGYYDTVDRCEGELVTPTRNPECFNPDGTRAQVEIFITVAQDCSFSAGGFNSGGSGSGGIGNTGGNGTGSNGNNGGGGTGSPPNTPSNNNQNNNLSDAVFPINNTDEDEEPIIHEDPCEKLENALTIAPINANGQNLNDIISSHIDPYINSQGKGEIGFTMSRDINGNITRDLLPPTQTRDMHPEFGGDVFFFMHTHNTLIIDGRDRFSQEDVIKMFQLWSHASDENKPKVMFLMKTRKSVVDPTVITYALQFGNEGKTLPEFIQSLGITNFTRDSFRIMYEKLEKYDKQPCYDADRDTKSFLRMYSGTNLNLLRAKTDASGKIIGWDKLSADPNDSLAPIVATPCN